MRWEDSEDEPHLKEPIRTTSQPLGNSLDLSTVRRNSGNHLNIFAFRVYIDLVMRFKPLARFRWRRCHCQCRGQLTYNFCLVKCRCRRIVNSLDGDQHTEVEGKQTVRGETHGWHGYLYICDQFQDIQCAHAILTGDHIEIQSLYQTWVLENVKSKNAKSGILTHPGKYLPKSGGMSEVYDSGTKTEFSIKTHCTLPNRSNKQ